MDKARKKINVSEAMAASLGVTDIEKKASAININPMDSNLEKEASMFIHQPTIENIEMYIRKYMLNELSFFPKILDLDIKIHPYAYNTAKKEEVSDATGIISIKVQKKMLEIPFLVQEGELIPFDVIQMEGQRVPFSRENLRKIIINLDKKQTEEQNNGGTGSPFLGVEKPVNPSTVSGFMGDALYIRDNHMQRRGGNNYVTASTECYEGLEKIADKKTKIKVNLDLMLDKVASLEPISQKEIDTIKEVLEKKAFKKAKAEMEKLAKEDEESLPTRKDIKALEKFENFKFKDANSLKHGTVISFPEVSASEIAMTPAIILNSFLDVNVKSQDNNKIVLAHDGRVAILENNKKFLCIETPSKLFKLPTTGFGSLKEKDTFLAFKGDKCLPPTFVESVVKRFVSDESDIFKRQVKIDTPITTVNCRFLKSAEIYNILCKEDGKQSYDYWINNSYSIFSLENTKFDTMKIPEYLKLKVQETGININELARACRLGISENKSVMCCDDNSKVIRITGFITTNIKDQSEFDNLYKLADAGYDISDGVEKVASQNTAAIECIDRSSKLYNVTISYQDTDTRFMNLRRQQFNRVAEGKLRAILRIMKFDGGKINEMIFKAKNEPRAVYPIPFSCTIADIKKLEGGVMANVSKENIVRSVNKFLNPQAVATSVATALAADLAADVIKGSINTNSPGKVFNLVSKFAVASENLSAEFEKAAIDNESDEMLEYAKLMSYSALFNNKVATVINDKNNNYPNMADIVSDIKMAKPYFEKVAYDMVSLKMNQFAHNANIINPVYLSEAVKSLDTMYKVACAVDSAIDKNFTFK